MGPGLRVGVCALCLAAAFAGGAEAALIIDDFTVASVNIAARATAFGGPPYNESLELSLPPEHTLGGRRVTWVAAGTDPDPALAESKSGAMAFTIDNDECQAGLRYLGLGSVDLTENGAAELLQINVNYLLSPLRDRYVSASIRLRDAGGVAVKNRYTLAHYQPGVGWVGESGTYGFNLNDWAPVDLAHVTDIELSFWGGPMFHDQFLVDDFVVAPEPAAALLLAALASALARGSGGRAVRRAGSL